MRKVIGIMGEDKILVIESYYRVDDEGTENARLSCDDCQWSLLLANMKREMEYS